MEENVEDIFYEEIVSPPTAPPPAYSSNTESLDKYYILNEPNNDVIMKNLVHKIKQKLIEDYKKIEVKFDSINDEIKSEMNAEIEEIRVRHQSTINMNNRNKEQELLKYNGFMEHRISELLTGNYEPTISHNSPDVIYSKTFQTIIHTNMMELIRSIFFR